MDRRSFLRAAMTGAAAVGATWLPGDLSASVRRSDLDYFRKMENFEADHPSDVTIGERELKVLVKVVSHLRRVQAEVGHGNFHLLSFDHMIKVGRNFSRVQQFSREELAFLEWAFYENAARYGFYGDKVLTTLTAEVPKAKVTKVEGTGQYLLSGRALEMYRDIKRSLGDDLILTSGIRGIVKQMYLFLNKALSTEGNLSRASRSLAPPGYSFHAVGDFDVGKRGLGPLNFTGMFAETDVYKRLVDLGFVKIRYPFNNLLGVRYEPWHIRVV